MERSFRSTAYCKRNPKSETQNPKQIRNSNDEKVFPQISQMIDRLESHDLKIRVDPQNLRTTLCAN